MIFGMSQEPAITALKTAPTAIPLQSGIGLASAILGGVLIPVIAFVGIASFFVSIAVNPIWFVMTLAVIAVMLGILSAGTNVGIAGATLGLVGFFFCMTFVFVDRLYGPEIRSQINTHPSKSPGLNLEQLFQAGGKNLPRPTTREN